MKEDKKKRDEDVSQPMELSLKRQKVDVTLTDEDGKPRKYYLQEMTGAERAAYMTEMVGKVTTDSNGQVKEIKDFSGMMSALIAKCLYESDTKKPVKQEEIDGWKSTVQDALFERASALNGLDKLAEERAKKA